MKHNSLLVGLTILPIAYLINKLHLINLNISPNTSSIIFCLGMLLLTLAVSMLAKEIPACLRLCPFGVVLVALKLFSLIEVVFSRFWLNTVFLLLFTLLELFLYLYFTYRLFTYLHQIATRYAYRASAHLLIVRNVEVILSVLSEILLLLTFVAPVHATMDTNIFLLAFSAILMRILVLGSVAISIWALVLLIGLRQAVKHFAPTAKDKNVVPPIPPAEN